MNRVKTPKNPKTFGFLGVILESVLVFYIFPLLKMPLEHGDVRGLFTGMCCPSSGVTTSTVHDGDDGGQVKP